MHKFITSTVGLMATNKRFERPLMVRVEFYRVNDEKIMLRAVSGNNLEPLGASVTISEEAWQESPADPYNDIVRARWAFPLVGWSIEAGE
jgi:hypothetical protein